MEWVKEVANLGVAGVVVAGAFWLLYAVLAQKAKDTKSVEPDPRTEALEKALEKNGELISSNTAAFNQLTKVLEVQAARDEEVTRSQRKISESMDAKLDIIRDEMRTHSIQCIACRERGKVSD